MVLRIARDGIARGRAFLASQSWDYLVALAAVVAAGGFSLFLLAYTLALPVSGDFHFRQSQTAIGIFYILQDGALIPYETPVLGVPWAAPYEAPVYHAVVAGLIFATGMDIEPAARLVSFSFLVGTIWFGSLILRQLLPGDRLSPVLFAVLMLAAPLELFFGRATLIETCAVFFGVAWLYLMLRAIIEERPDLAFISIPLCALCALAKMTTWPAFIAAGGLFCVAQWVLSRRLPARSLAVVGLGVAVSLALAFWWIAFSDEIKSHGLLTQSTTSDGLAAWNYGTLADRFSARLWLETLPKRMLPDLWGWLWPMPLVGLALLNLRSRHFAIAALSVVLFFVPLAIFTNLHIVHAYYQMANGLFLMAAAAVTASALISRFDARLIGVAFVLLVAGQYVRFADVYWGPATADSRATARYQVARFVRAATPPGTALISIGFDWSSVLHLYAERKGLAMPSWIAKPVLAEFLHDPRTLLGDMPIGAVVNCGFQGIEHRTDILPLLNTYLAESEARAKAHGQVQVFGQCTVYVLG